MLRSTNLHRQLHDKVVGEPRSIRTSPPVSVSQADDVGPSLVLVSRKRDLSTPRARSRNESKRVKKNLRCIDRDTGIFTPCLVSLPPQTP